MTRLARALARRIAEKGPISVAEFMEQALGSRAPAGYYMDRDPLGAEGDFITAPEISQMFGELIGLWCAVIWDAMGSPRPVRLAELGPGRGTLMADALRAVAQAAPAFRGAVEISLVETSPVLRDRQRQALGKARAVWHESLDAVPPGPLLLIANEFFDALPIRQFVRTRAGWRERLVDTDPAGGGFRFVLAAEESPAVSLVPSALAGAPVGSLVEVCPEGRRLATAIARRVVHDGGAALVIDYGHVRSAAGETLQAVSGHRYADPLTAPGTVDLTAHVDFQALAEAARGEGARVHGPRPQGAFLRALAIEERQATLLRRASPTQAEAIQSGCRRLIDPGQMGSLFKALAIAHPALPVPPGFEG